MTMIAESLIDLIHIDEHGIKSTVVNLGWVITEDLKFERTGDHILTNTIYTSQ